MSSNGDKSMAEIIAECRAKQQAHETRIPVQLEISEERERIAREVVEQEGIEILLTLAVADVPWASADEADAQWRKETVEDWGFPSDWIEARA